MFQISTINGLLLLLFISFLIFVILSILIIIVNIRIKKYKLELLKIKIDKLYIDKIKEICDYLKIEFDKGNVSHSVLDNIQYIVINEIKSMEDLYNKYLDEL